MGPESRSPAAIAKHDPQGGSCKVERDKPEKEKWKGMLNKHAAKAPAISSRTQHVYEAWLLRMTYIQG